MTMHPELICDNGAVYEGEHHDMKPDGVGKNTLRNGTTYQGEFKNS